MYSYDFTYLSKLTRKFLSLTIMTLMESCNIEINQMKNKTASNLSYTEILPKQASLKAIEKQKKQSNKDEKFFPSNITGLSINNNLNNVSSDDIITGSDTTQNSDLTIKKITNITKQSIKRKIKLTTKPLKKLINQKKRTTPKRSKRAMNKELDNTDLNEQIPPNRFYRHPELTYEKQLSLKLAKDMNLNFGNVLSKRVLDMFKRPHVSSKIEALSRESSKHNYAPVILKCNDSENSEVSDLNKPVLAHTQNLNENEKYDDNDDGDDLSDAPRKFEYSKSNENLSEENVESAIERSLPAKESEVPLVDQKSTVLTIKEQVDKIYTNIEDHQRSIKETTSDMPVYDPDKIPYVDVPDYSDIREESLDEEDRRKSEQNIKQQDVEFIDVEARERAKSSESSKVNESEESDKIEVSKDLKKLKHELEGTLGRVEGLESRENSREVEQESNSTMELESIFDINEYRKPFNLDEFLKDDPIMKKLELLEKETRAIYRKIRKRVPGSFNGSESDNAPTEQAGKREDSAEGRDGFDYLSSSSNRINTFAKYIENDNSDKDKDEDVMKFVFKKSKKKGAPRFEKAEKFLSQCFTEDAARNLEKDADVEGYRERKDVQSKEDTYDALSTVLNKKTRVSRLNEDIDKRIKARDNSPLMYKNFWSLEYSSPRKKVDMVAQEKRK